MKFFRAASALHCRGKFVFIAACRKFRSQPSSPTATKFSARKEIGDYDGAANGLQVENSGEVTRIAAAVDASLATVKLAIAAKADLLIVHHGLFWIRCASVDRKIPNCCGLLVENNLAVYSSHLPLDAHPKLGNNAQLCAALGLKNLKPFFFEPGTSPSVSRRAQKFPGRT